jgi:antitoxin ChpS
MELNTTSLRKVGGSVMLAVPPALLNILDLHSGTEVGLTVERGNLIVKPLRRPRYSLDQLLKQCNPRARRARNDADWVSDKPVGRELI